MNYSDELTRQLAKQPGVIALVGFSPRPGRASNDVAQYLIQAGLQVYLVNPMYAGTESLGQKVLKGLEDIPEHIHIVDIFRKSEDIGPIIDQAISVKVDYIWLQLDISNPDEEKKAIQAGLGVVKNRCLKVEHMRVQYGG